MKKLLPILFIITIVFIFFWQFIFKGLLPLPSDTIVGLYHPFRDLYIKNYPNGIPFKNFLITDPVRQQYPWRDLAISTIKRIELPLWNPYNFSGIPLLANIQSAPFYIFNILFFIFPFSIGWSIIIFLGPLLGGIFLYLYLANLKLNKWASLLGAISFSFSGFFVAWMQWGTIPHVVLWLPLILLSIDKIFLYFSSNISKLKSKKYFMWLIIFIFSLSSSFFAGHLQIFFYLFMFSLFYILAKWANYSRKKNMLFLFIVLYAVVGLITFVQWFTALQLITLSARNLDQTYLNNPGWFMPWQNIIQFLIPDFFGNPTTMNYWGIWNYAEFIGYIGIVSIVFSVFAIFFRYDKKTFFFGTILFLSLIIILPTFISKAFFSLNIPFLGTSQPTRLLFLIDFSLSVLAALGFDYYLKNKRKIFNILVFFVLVFSLLWIFVLWGKDLKIISLNDLSVAKNNMIFPTLIFIAFFFVIFFDRIKKPDKRISSLLSIIIIVLLSIDLLRFSWKFSPFTDKSYLFPNTQVTSFLQKEIGEFRFMSTDSRIFPPNFSIIYRIQSVDGYDPLYLRRYGELVAASERGKANIDAPFGFNRIITPHVYESKIIDLLGVRFVLSLSELNSLNFKKVFQEGETRVYKNISALPRTFFLAKTIEARDNKEAIKMIFDKSFDLSNTAVIETGEDKLFNTKKWSVGKAKIIKYSENKVTIDIENSGEGFLILTDSFYPTWKAKIDNSREAKIYRTDYNFRGIIVPQGKHRIEFYNTLI